VCSDPVTAADRVACFSNSATFLTLLAPGALIDAAGFRMAGTSQAAPHVAGAAAVLRAALPAETASQLVTRMVSGAARWSTPRTGRTTPRLDLAAALVARRPTGRRPVGTVVINAGAPTPAPARSRSPGRDRRGRRRRSVRRRSVRRVRAIRRPPVVTTMPTGADGTRTVAVRYRDRAGNIANPVTDTIVLDTIAPGLTLSGSTSGGRVAWTWSGADATSGVASYRLVVASGTTAPPAGCATGTLLAQGTTTSFTHGPLAVGSTWSYRLCATDRAGNTAGGLAITVVVR
jgi:subtilisin family serine protease